MDRDAAHWAAVEEATELLHEERFKEALEALRDVIKADPENPYAFFFLGQGLYATAGALDGASGLFVADSLGRIHKLAATGQPDQYSVVTSPWASPSTVAGLYAGLVPLMVRGDFHPSTGEELLVLNHYLDWVLISASGSQLARWWRTTDATSPE